MSKQVLIINITRMGDLVQMVPLLRRLEHEWPGVSIDLVVDTGFVSMANILPGIRQVLAYDFQSLMDDSRVHARDVVSLYQDVATWAKPLVHTGYDRIINLTFNRRSACLVGHIGAPDVRGLTTAPDGSFVVKNPWMMYFMDMHSYRRFNRFNLVDIYALGGSGPGPYAPVTLQVDPESRDWATGILRSSGNPGQWIAVQIGASDVMKAWRPELFGRTLAMLGKRANVGFVLIGTEKESSAVHEAMVTYREAQGSAPICYTLGKTTIPQLVGLLSQCHVMLTNDTGPMHLAVGVGTPIVNLSVGHVDFRETGPFGPGHWVVQPEIECGPCGFDQVCPHHACKDRVIPEQVASLCLSVLGLQPFPSSFTGVRIYEAGVDEDQLGTYRLRGGHENQLHAWYGLFWRKFWYDICGGAQSQLEGPQGHPPDFYDVQQTYHQFLPIVDCLCRLSEEIANLSAQSPIPAARIQASQERLNAEAHRARVIGCGSLALRPITTACFRATYNLSSSSLQGLAQEHAQAYATWRDHLLEVGHRLHIHDQIMRRPAYACSA